MSYDRPSAKLMTLAEYSVYRETGRADEVERLCDAFARTWPEAVNNYEFGRTAEGRPMRALIVSRTGSLSPDETQRRGIPVLMIQAGIHPGESDGKDAGFIALREMLSGAAGPEVLERIVVLFVPAFNTDGHERFGRWNRPNQLGPEETGWRTTAQNLNLNRDYMKADSPEMQAMLRLLNEWDPLVCADLHVTDGADFEPDVSIQVEPIHQGDPQLYASGVQLRDALIAKLAQQGSQPLPFYPDLFRVDDPASGFMQTVYSPRFSTGYFPTRNRFTVLVETHSWKNYAIRIRVTRNTIVGLAELVSKYGREWLEEVHRSDVEAVKVGGTEVPLAYSASWREPDKRHESGDSADCEDSDGDPNVTMIEFRGYAYTRKLSPISGELVTVYDPFTPQIWRVPFRKNLSASLIMTAPRCGYVVPAAYGPEISQKLKLHGIRFERFTAGAEKMMVEAFRTEQVEFSPRPVEGRTRVTLSGTWRSETRDIPPSSLFVPIRQSRSRLVMSLFEPQAPDSFAAWGFFNGCFEQKEYLEPYVAEIIAQEMLTRDPQLAETFNRRLATDPAFAANAAARLEFFQRRHASWDERFNLYPVYRLEKGR